MALTTYTISWTPTPGSFGTLIEYKQKEDSTWIVPSTTPNPTLFSTYELTLDNSFNYDVRLSVNGGNCTKRYRYAEILNEPDPVTYIWIVDDYICEESVIYIIDTTYSNFSSPFLVYYYPANGRVYVADNDRAAGNAYWFDPITFTGVGDINSISGLISNVYNAAIDETNSRLYFIGKDTGGLKSLDLDTETFSTTTCGVDGVNFNRLQLFVGPTSIYTTDEAEEELYIIDRSSLALVSTLDINTIPSGITYVGQTGNARTLIQIGNEFWTCASFSSASDIAVYNTAFTSLITTFAVPGAAVVGAGFEGGGGSRYRQSIVYDSVNDRVYIGDVGSSLMHVFEGSTRIFIKTLDFSLNLEGKLHTITDVVQEKLSGDWFIRYRGMNTSSDGSPKLRTYKLKRDDSTIEFLITGIAISDVSPEVGTNQAWAASSGLREWDGGAWATDGEIYKLVK